MVFQYSDTSSFDFGVRCHSFQNPSCISDWQQKLTYAGYMTSSIQKPTVVPALIKKQGLTGTAWSTQIFCPFEESPFMSLLTLKSQTTCRCSRAWKPQALPTYWLSVKCQLSLWYGCNEEKVARFQYILICWGDFTCKTLKGVRQIYSYAFKMRQDYLSTRYLDHISLVSGGRYFWSK